MATVARQRHEHRAVHVQRVRESLKRVRLHQVPDGLSQTRRRPRQNPRVRRLDDQLHPGPLAEPAHERKQPIHVRVPALLDAAHEDHAPRPAVPFKAPPCRSDHAPRHPRDFHAALALLL
ncbi:hypothetical protein K4K52_012038 [Colletotrichum sp. SAR 10_76]|nr:hypothetical protein K4K52_012038 [Colletotrichum sp. SAR 10_76]